VKSAELTTTGKMPNGPYRNIANLRLLENFQMVRTETLRTYNYWKISKWSVPKHCELTSSVKFPNGPYRNIANLRLLENFQMVRTETLQTHNFWKISK
jgi:hypothetical protein